MPLVRVRDSMGHERVCPLDTDIVTFGRSPGCGLLLGGRGVSRLHGRFIRDGEGQWWVEDLGAKNGILVGGRYVTRHRLADGDAVAVGELTLVFSLLGFADGASLYTSVTISDRAPGPGSTIERSPTTISTMDTRRLTALYDISKRLMGRRDVVGLADVAASALMTELDAEVVVLGLTVDPEREPDRVLVRTVGARAAGVTLSRSVLKRTIEARRALLVADVASDERFITAESIAAGGICAAMCVPMMRGEDVTGFIYVDNRRQRRSYEDRDLEFAAAIGAMVGTAIENARLGEAEMARHRMEAELERARRVQQAILPSNWPALEGWDINGDHRTCREVGGDYFDAVIAADGRLWLLIADVCGKGVGAAMVASSVHALAHVLVDQCATPGRLLERLNKYLVVHEVGSSFVTCLAVALDPATGEAVMASAGHPHPLYVNADQAPARIPIEGGFMLGVFPDAAFADHHWSFPGRPGTLLLFTDGIPEALNEQDQQFTEERLLSVLATERSDTAEELVTAVRREVEAFRGDHEQSDDLTILACRRVPPSPAP